MYFIHNFIQLFFAAHFHVSMTQIRKIAKITKQYKFYWYTSSSDCSKFLSIIAFFVLFSKHKKQQSKTNLR